MAVIIVVHILDGSDISNNTKIHQHLILLKTPKLAIYLVNHQAFYYDT